MGTMLSWLSRRVVKQAWTVVLVWAALAAVLLVISLTGVGGEGLFQRLGTGLAQVDGSESAEGQDVLDTLAGDGETVSLLVTDVDISTPEKQEAVAEALTDAHVDLTGLVGETGFVDPFVIPGTLTQPAAQALASRNLDGFLVIVTVDPNGAETADEDDSAASAERDQLRVKVEERLAQVPAELRTVAPDAGGIVSDEALVSDTITHQVERDLVTGELVSLPLALIIMVLVFGGFLAAGMPLVGALVSIAGSLGVAYALTYAMDLESFVVNIITVIGLGLSIDYGLLITSRYREELARSLTADQELERAAPEGDPARAATAPALPRRRRRSRRGRRDPLVAEALEVTLTTAGRTVLFSALTVAISLLGLVVMRPALLRSIGIAGVAVVLIAVAAAITLVPAMLALLGRRLVHPSPLQRVPGLGALQRRLGDVSSDEGVFSALARRVQAHPWVVLVGCLAFLVVLAAPVRHLHMLNSTTELLPPDSAQHTYLSVLAEDYAAEDAAVVVAGTGETVTGYLDKVAEVPGVTSVLSTAQAGDYTVAYLDLDGDPGSRTAEAAVDAVRAIDAPDPAWVIGQAATQLDFRAAVMDGLPWVVSVIALATFVLLFLMTGSVLVPLKALVVNTLSLAASMGLATWIFQEGHGSSLIGFTPIGGVESYVVVVAMAFGFGLAMDYEVFLLARIKEYWDAGMDNDTAVQRGLQRSGRIVTSAALIMVLVFLGFVAGRLLVIKEVGLTLVIIVALDATVVRMLLVPATMTLLGRWSWWAPAPLRRLHERFGIRH